MSWHQLFLGTAYFQKLCFPLLSWRFPAKGSHSPSWHLSEGKVPTSDPHHAWLGGSLACVQAAPLPLMSVQGVRVDYATGRLFALRLKVNEVERLTEREDLWIQEAVMW